MKQVIFAVIICLLLCPIAAIAEKYDLNSLDGSDWSEWASTQKHAFISGYLAGSSYVVQYNQQNTDENYDNEKVSKAYLSYLLPDQKKPKNSFSRKDVDMIVYNIKDDFNSSLNSCTIYGITNGQIVEGLNSFYTDFKNKQIKLKDSIHVVKKQINGSSTEEIEAVLQYLRSGKEFGKLLYTDKDGKKKYARFP